MNNVLLLLLNLISLTSSMLVPLNDESPQKQSLVQCIVTASRTYFPPTTIISISIPPISDSRSINPTEEFLFSEFMTLSEWPILTKMPSLPMVGTQFFGANRRLAAAANATLVQPMVNENSTFEEIVTVLKRRTQREATRYPIVKSDAYVILMKELANLKTDLEGIISHPSWNPLAKFMVVSTRTYENSSDVILDIIKKLWNVNVLNGVIIFPSTTTDVFDIISWYPYANGKCGYNVDTFQTIASCYFGNISNNDEWFTDKIPKTMNGCSVIVHTMPYPPFVIPPRKHVPGSTNQYYLRSGLEIQLLNLIAELSNFKVEYYLSGKETDYGFIRRSTAGSGILSDVFNGSANIGLASLPLTEENTNSLDPSIDYIHDSLSFCVPHALEKPHGQKLYQLVTPSVWFALFFTAVLISYLVHTFSSQLSNGLEPKAFSSYGNLNLKLFSIAIGSAINQQPNTSRVRYILMLWVILSLYTVASYQTYLTSGLTKPAYQTQITTIDGIIKSNLKLLIQKASLKFFLSSANDGSFDVILNRADFCNNLEKCFYRTAHSRDSVIIASTVYSSFAKDAYKSSSNMPLLYCFKDPIVTYPIVMYMQKGYPLRKKMNTIISNAIAAGYIDWWTRNLYRSKKLNLTRELPTDTTTSEKLLKFEHMQPIMFMFVIGIAIAMTAFVGELVCSRVSLKKVKSKFRKLF